jgi:undecaprenyl diphosphate synthase
MMSYKEQISPQGLPLHVAIIMDGNGRWAKKRNKPRIFGHSAGVKSVRRVVEASREIGIKHLTLYTFSIENWKRPQDEVSSLMTLLVKTIKSEFDDLNKNNVRVKVIGNYDLLPEKIKKEVITTQELSKNNTALTLNIALSYGSQWEIADTARRIAIETLNGKIKPEDITTDLFEKHLLTAHSPSPELLIRTSGEYRISNFLLYQMAYTELYFTDTLWPDFDKEEFFKAINFYQQRERRFGMTSEQIMNKSQKIK